MNKSKSIKSNATSKRISNTDLNITLEGRNKESCV